MRARIRRLRYGLAEALVNVFADLLFKRIASENGMFSLLPISPEKATALSQNYAIYVPGSGRINIAGMTIDSASYIANALHSVCSRS